MSRRLILLLIMAMSYTTAGATEQWLQGFLNRLNSLKADFEQTVYETDGSLLQRSSGEMLMRRPSRFRWDYREPYQQLIVADGERLWLYDKDLEQVTVRRLDDALSATPLAVLSGAAPVGDTFDLVAVYQRDKLDWYELKPKAQSSDFTRLRVAFNAGTLAVIELEDSLQQRTRLQLDNVEINIDPDPFLFRFFPPPDVDVVGDG